MSSLKYNVPLKEKQQNMFMSFLSILIIITTVYSLYISQHADFFIINMMGIAEFTGTSAGKNIYGFILLISCFKLFMLWRLLNTKDIIKKTISAFCCLLAAAILGMFSFGQICTEMVNNNIYYCPQSFLTEGKSNLVIICLLGFICYKGYKKIEIIQKKINKSGGGLNVGKI